MVLLHQFRGLYYESLQEGYFGIQVRIVIGKFNIQVDPYLNLNEWFNYSSCLYSLTLILSVVCVLDRNTNTYWRNQNYDTSGVTVAMHSFLFFMNPSWFELCGNNLQNSV